MKLKYFAIFIVLFCVPDVFFAYSKPDIWVITTGGESAFYDLLSENNNVIIKTTDEINNGIPADVELLIYPGGLLPITQVQDSVLQTSIQNYVNSGGAFFGSCGGSITGAQELMWDYPNALDMIGLLPVNATDHLSWTSLNYLDGYNFNSSSLNGAYQSSAQWLLYTGGPAFNIISGNEDQVEVLASFANNFDPSVADYQVIGKPAIVNGHYGNGRVILSAPHPESDDSTNFLFYNYINYLLLHPPTNIVASEISYQTANISWTEAASDISSYTISYSPNEDFTAATEITGLTSTSTVLNSLQNNTQYYLKIKAHTNENESDYSEAISFTTLNPVPDQVTNIIIPKKYKKKQQVKIKWLRQENATGYTIRLFNKNKKFIRKIKVNENIAVKTVKNLKAGTKYYVKIRAKREVANQIYYGKYSSNKKFVTKK